MEGGVRNVGLRQSLRSDYRKTWVIRVGEPIGRVGWFIPRHLTYSCPEGNKPRSPGRRVNRKPDYRKTWVIRGLNYRKSWVIAGGSLSEYLGDRYRKTWVIGSPEYRKTWVIRGLNYRKSWVKLSEELGGKVRI